MLNLMSIMASPLLISYYTYIGTFPLIITIKSGAIHISQALIIKYTLSKLNLRENDIGDEGIAAIAKALVNSDISILNVSKCGITFNGAKLLAQSLPAYHNIEELWLYHNAITVDGVHLIMQSAIATTKCEAVWVDPMYINDGSVKKLMIYTLDERPKVRKIIYYNKKHC